LWVIANNRLMHDPQTRTYAARRTATGASRKEILRLLKRYIAGQVFAEIRHALGPPNPVPNDPLTSGRLLPKGVAGRLAAASREWERRGDRTPGGRRSPQSLRPCPVAA
jgi:hypothetical protein